MKKVISLSLFTLIYVNAYSQFSWLPVIDNNDLYVSGAPIRALYSDTFTMPPKLYLGGGPNQMTNINTGSNCCGHTFYYYTISNYFGDHDCLPISPVDTALVLNFSGAPDTSYNQFYLSVGGSFRDEGCTIPNAPEDLRNLIFYEGGGMPSFSLGDMSASDTVFAVAVLADYDNPCPVSPELYFRTYVGSRCAYCSIYDSASVDSSRYIAFYDPAVNCVSNSSYNYMQGGSNGPVHALIAIDTANVYAGGIFDSAGVIAANNIAKWNGIGWDSLGSGANGEVKVLLYYNGNLYAGGNFTMAGGIPANNIAMWNGSAWSALGSGTNGTVNAMTIHNGELYAGGNFTQAGSSVVNYVAKWDGTSWSDLHGGRNGEVFALASFKGDLFVGGNFTGGINDTVKYFVAYHDSTLNIEDQEETIRLVAFPNPVNDKIYFSIENTQCFSITVINASGEVVFCRDFKNQSVADVSTSEFAPGIYFFRIQDNSLKSASGKFVVEH